MNSPHGKVLQPPSFVTLTYIIGRFLLLTSAGLPVVLVPKCYHAYSVFSSL